MTGLDATDAAILAMWDDGASIRSIAAALNVGEPQVEAIVAVAGERFDHVSFSRWVGSEAWEERAS